MNMPLDIRELMKSSASAREEREQPVRIAVFVDAEAPEALVEAVKSALHPQTGLAILHVEAVVAGDLLEPSGSVDAVVALAGPGDVLEPSLKASRDKLVPTVALALGEERDSASRRLSQPLLDTLVGSDAEKVVTELGTWLADRVSGKRLALAANFSFVRRAVANESVKATAFQNAVIGGVVVIPGADMPLMTANQAKMLLQIAAAYGEPLGAERIKELAAVVGGGFAFRAIARQVLTAIPGFGWAVKAGIGYSGTLAMGYAAVEYFESGGDVRGLAEKVREARDKVVGAAASRVLRDKRETIPASAVVLDEDLALPEPASGEGASH
jgi:uncharacterized protein (DUF697 family)